MSTSGKTAGQAGAQAPAKGLRRQTYRLTVNDITIYAVEVEAIIAQAAFDMVETLWTCHRAEPPFRLVDVRSDITFAGEKGGAS